jgi:hypothetical protein
MEIMVSLMRERVDGLDHANNVLYTSSSLFIFCFFFFHSERDCWLFPPRDECEDPSDGEDPYNGATRIPHLVGILWPIDHYNYLYRGKIDLEGVAGRGMNSLQRKE